ncbi:hypothetical protein Dcar01_01834 [Deinococcus carri]|uniref:Integrase catalytic domain-containing protein n=1 Tax=Deinococcus carri TaxID=1211323 RepID=A0ABP9W999_9DEIO
MFDGEVYTVVGFAGATIRLRSVHDRISIASLSDVVATGDFKILDGEDEGESNDSFVSLDITAEQRQAATTRLAHLREAITGFRSGYAELALPGEPRDEYNPGLVGLTSRMRNKAEELEIGLRTLYRDKANYDKLGFIGLVDRRQIRPVNPTGRADHRLVAAIDQVIQDQKDKTNVGYGKLRRDIVKLLGREHGEGEVKIPSIPTLNKLITERSRGKYLNHSSKTRRGAASKPSTPYRRFEAQRPGEYVMIDSTPLDAFGMDPISLEWIPLQLVLAVDVYSRSILAWRIVHRDKQVDAALMLYDIIRPKRFHPHIPESSRWSRTYVGVPENIVVNLSETDLPEGVMAVPVIRPENVIVDRGKIYMSAVFERACVILGINVQPARPRTGSDKSYVERMFNTIGSMFLQYVPGYKGPNVWSRGTPEQVEEEAFSFVDELEVYFADWVCSFWQKRWHPGLWEEIAPGLKLTPNERYEEGITRAGFVYVPRNVNLYYELLPVAWVTVDDAGLRFKNMLYDGPVLDPCRHRTSPYGGEHEGKWPVSCDPRDLSRLFFYDLDSRSWQPVRRVHTMNPDRPFNDVTLGFVKSLILSRGGENLKPTREQVSRALDAVLDRMDDAVLEKRSERRLAARRLEEARQAARDRTGGNMTGTSLAATLTRMGESDFLPAPTSAPPRFVDGGSPMQLLDDALRDHTISGDNYNPDVWEDE